MNNRAEKTGDVSGDLQRSKFARKVSDLRDALLRGPIGDFAGKDDLSLWRRSQPDNYYLLGLADGLNANIERLEAEGIMLPSNTRISLTEGQDDVLKEYAELAPLDGHGKQEYYFRRSLNRSMERLNQGK